MSRPAGVYDAGIAETQALDRVAATAVFGADGRLRRANAHFLQLFGYAAEALVGQPHALLLPAGDADSAGAALWAALRAGEEQRLTVARRRRDGSEFWVRASYVPITGADGEFAEVVLIAIDFSAEQRRAVEYSGERLAIDRSHAVVHFGLDGSILDANENFLAATGYRLSEVKGRHHRIFVDAETAASPAYAAFWADLARGEFHCGEFLRLRKDGSELWLRANYNPILDTDGRPFKVVKFSLDVTRERLLQLDREGQIAAIHKSQCVATFDLDGTVLDANARFLAAFGYARDEVLGRHHRMFMDPVDAESEDYAVFWQSLRLGRFTSARYRRIGKGGREVWIQASYNPILDLMGRPLKIVKIASDVTRNVSLAAEVETVRRQAEHDAITDLPNRLRLEAFMAETLQAPGARVVAFFLDLDHFKPVNDSFGHAIGDLVLKTTAERLRRALRPGDMVARVGGDEFVVVAPGLGNEEVDALCRRLLDVVTAPISIEGRALCVGLSIGVAVAPDDATSFEALLRCADTALYRTKRNGRNGYSAFSAALQAHLAGGQSGAGPAGEGDGQRNDNGPGAPGPG